MSNLKHKAIKGRITSSFQDGVWSLKLQNVIDESVGFPLALPLRLKHVHVDLGEVTYFNSAGVARWISWIETVCMERVVVVLSRIPFAFIRASGYSRGMVPRKVVIDNFYLEQFCVRCGEHRSVLIENRDNLALAPEQCAACKVPLKLEVPLEAYRSLIAHAPKG